MSFIFGLLAIQFCPGDAVYRNLKKEKTVRIAVGLAVSVYKLRKTNHVLETIHPTLIGPSRDPNSLYNLGMITLLVVLAIDGSAIVRGICSLSSVKLDQVRWSPYLIGREVFLLKPRK